MGVRKWNDQRAVDRVSRNSAVLSYSRSTFRPSSSSTPPIITHSHLLDIMHHHYTCYLFFIFTHCTDSISILHSYRAGWSRGIGLANDDAYIRRSKSLSLLCKILSLAFPTCYLASHPLTIRNIIWVHTGKIFYIHALQDVFHDSEVGITFEISQIPIFGAFLPRSSPARIMKEPSSTVDFSLMSVSISGTSSLMYARFRGTAANAVTDSRWKSNVA